MKDLISLLQHCEQEVEPNLILLKDEFESGGMNMDAVSDVDDHEE